MIGERPEPHLLRAVDWFDSQGIRRDIDKHTLDGEAREWYADYAKQTDVIPPWNTLINDFSRYYSSQGRVEKNLHEAWRNMSFTPATDDVEVFLRDLQECAGVVIGSKIVPKRRRTKRKETLKTLLQALVKLPKISMEQELQTCSMESQTYMWRVMKKTTS